MDASCRGFIGGFIGGFSRGFIRGFIGTMRMGFIGGFIGDVCRGSLGVHWGVHRFAAVGSLKSLKKSRNLQQISDLARKYPKTAQSDGNIHQASKILD